MSESIVTKRESTRVASLGMWSFDYTPHRPRPPSKNHVSPHSEETCDHSTLTVKNGILLRVYTRNVFLLSLLSRDVLLLARGMDLATPCIV